MVNEKGYILDRREMLSIKLKSLAMESRLIRQTERRMPQALRLEMWQHRLGCLRKASRETHLALGFIRGRRYEQLERTCHKAPDWDNVARMIARYGYILGAMEKDGQAAIRRFLDEWANDPTQPARDLMVFYRQYSDHRILFHRVNGEFVPTETPLAFYERWKPEALAT